METLGKRIKYLLEINGVKRSDLQKNIDISPGNLSDIINDKNRNPTIKIILAIAQNFDCDIHWLLTGESYEGKYSKISEKDINYEIGKKLKNRIKLPNGIIIDERRKIFKQPYIVEICRVILRFSDDMRYKMYEVMKIFEEKK